LRHTLGLTQLLKAGCASLSRPTTAQGDKLINHGGILQFPLPRWGTTPGEGELISLPLPVIIPPFFGTHTGLPSKRESGSP
jgi:hypothetical protein